MISGSGKGSSPSPVPAAAPAPPPRSREAPPLAARAAPLAARAVCPVPTPGRVRLCPADPPHQLAQFRHGQPGAGRQHHAVPGPPDGHAAVTADLDLVGPQVDHRRGVLVHAEHRGPGRQLALHPGQAPFAEVAVAGVVGAALGVVVVRDQRHRKAEQAEQVQAAEPVRVGAGLVDLVHRQRGAAEVAAAAEAITVRPSTGRDPVPQSLADAGLASHRASAYVGLPGPLNTQPAVRSGRQAGGGWPARDPAGAGALAGGSSSGNARPSARRSRRSTPGPGRDVRAVLLERVRGLQEQRRRRAGRPYRRPGPGAR